MIIKFKLWNKGLSRTYAKVLMIYSQISYNKIWYVELIQHLLDLLLNRKPEL